MTNKEIIDRIFKDPNTKYGHYLITFLNSSYCRRQLIRYNMPSVQGKLELQDIKKLRIIRSDEHEHTISHFVNQAQSLIRESDHRKTLADNILRSEINLVTSDIPSDKYDVITSSKLLTIGRMDPDYFLPKYRYIERFLDMKKTVALGDICSVKKGVEVGTKEYRLDGKLFLRVSNVNRNGIVLLNSNKYISEILFNQLAEHQPKNGELLLTKDGSPGICYVVSQDLPCIISGGIVRLKPLSDQIPIEYLSAVINSEICQMQIDQESSGALIKHWKPSSIEKLRIPLISDDRMAEISSLIIESKLKLETSKLLQKNAIQMADMIAKEAFNEL